MGVKSRTAVAPCSTANLGPGYDVFGLALDALEDTVKIAERKDSGRDSAKILITIRNTESAIPVEVESNSAGLVVKKMAQDFGIKDRLQITIKKGIPAGYGIGSSAASAAAAAVAFKSLYSLKIDRDSMVEYAAEGEVASAGTKHYDNVSASLLGGFVISGFAGTCRNFIKIVPPKDLVLVVAIPHSVPVPDRKTELARSVLPKEVFLRDAVRNLASASTVVAGVALKDVAMMARGIYDVIVEPARKRLIPAYDPVKQRALAAGALAVAISGAGPSMIAFLRAGSEAAKVAKSMKEAYAGEGIKSRTIVCRPSRGARLV